MSQFNKKVFVAMSGGVDSSVAALLLKNQGYDVLGVYMKNWSEPVLGEQCAWERDQEDARRVAGRLDIPFYTFDFEREYKQEVVDYMIKEYALGRTPNPDVMCNKIIKFGLFLQKALALGADYVATGHYVKVKNAKVKIQNASSKFKISLLAAKDSNKDQSYFLWTLTQDRLKYCLFPIGDYTKPEVRQIAKEAGLSTAHKLDSQGVCFMGEFSMQEFLRQYIPEKTGEVVTTGGQRIGQHPGVNFYTIGQRHGIGIGGGVPYYVVQKDISTNRLVIVQGPKDDALYKRKAIVSDINWISEEPQLPKKVMARIRYRQELQEALLMKYEGGSMKQANEVFDSFHNSSFILHFSKPQRAVTPGQSAVFYDTLGDVMLGGGVIQ